MIYYVFISTIYSIVYIFGIWSAPIALILLGISGAAVVFSIYLVSLQAFIVKHWCAWCLSSAAISVLIFTLAYLHMAW